MQKLAVCPHTHQVSSSKLLTGEAGKTGVKEIKLSWSVVVHWPTKKLAIPVIPVTGLDLGYSVLTCGNSCSRAGSVKMRRGFRDVVNAFHQCKSVIQSPGLLVN